MEELNQTNVVERLDAVADNSEISQTRFIDRHPSFGRVMCTIGMMAAFAGSNELIKEELDTPAQAQPRVERKYLTQDEAGLIAATATETANPEPTPTATPTPSPTPSSTPTAEVTPVPTPDADPNKCAIEATNDLPFRVSANLNRRRTEVTYKLHVDSLSESCKKLGSRAVNTFLGVQDMRINKKRLSMSGFWSMTKFVGRESNDAIDITQKEKLIRNKQVTGGKKHASLRCKPDKKGHKRIRYTEEKTIAIWKPNNGDPLRVRIHLGPGIKNKQSC